MSTYRRVTLAVVNYMFYWVAKITTENLSNVKTWEKKRNIDYTICIKQKVEQGLFIAANFIAKCQSLSMGCLLTRENEQKKHPIFDFQKRPCPLIKQCLLTKSVKYTVCVNLHMYMFSDHEDGSCPKYFQQIFFQLQDHCTKENIRVLVCC